MHLICRRCGKVFRDETLDEEPKEVEFEDHHLFYFEENQIRLLKVALTELCTDDRYHDLGFGKLKEVEEARVTTVESKKKLSKKAQKSKINVIQTEVVPEIILECPFKPLNRRIVISPTQFCSGIGLTDSSMTLEHWKSYMKTVVYDEIVFLIKKPVVEEKKNLIETHYKKYEKSELSKKKVELDELIAVVNILLFTDDQKEVKGFESCVCETINKKHLFPTVVCPNYLKRYHSVPCDGYLHSSLIKSQPVWKNDPDMWEQCANILGPLLVKGELKTVKPLGKDKLELRQIPWKTAKILLPRPLLNMIFDLRFQFEPCGALFIDERTPDELKRKKTTPGEGGTLRSWHQDSHEVLPSPTFESETRLPEFCKALHNHYKEFSGEGSGSSIVIGKYVGPQGLAEYTGTGSNTEHNTKVVVDYINKRIYLTLSHYQYCCIIKKEEGKYVWWMKSGTQELSKAWTDLDKESGEKFLMSPWMEILLPNAEDY